MQLAAGCQTRLLPAATCPNATGSNSLENDSQLPSPDQPDQPAAATGAAEAASGGGTPHMQEEVGMHHCLPPEVDATVAQLQQQMLAAAVNDSHVVGL